METKLTFEIEADEVEIFLQDVNEHLETMETGILRLEQGLNLDTLNATFRAAHTVKAVAATVGHTPMAELTHALEAFFDALRENGVTPSHAMADELLAIVDALKALRDEVVTQEPGGVDVDACLAQLGELTDSLSREGVPPTAQDEPHVTQSLLTPEQMDQVQDHRERGYAIWEVQATARVDAFGQGARLLQVTLALLEVGHIITQQPSQADLTQGQHSGHLWLILAAQADTGVIEDILRGISDLAEFRVQPYDPAHLALASAAEAATDAPAPQDRLAVDLSRPAGDQTVRISVERLDALMNLVGELVTDRTRLAQIQDSLRVQYGKNGAVGALNDMSAHFNRVVDQLQEEVMQARMLPIAHLFRKFPRIVRDIARASGKQVNLIIEGENTELDRSVIEVIGDPLIHLLRNAVDHGIEPPQERIAAGKPPSGSIWLTAAPEEGHIVITVKDDGRGIDPERIRCVAVSRGLMSEEEAAHLDDDAAVNLVFQPNLSTAEQVTDVSGRGVGLDVVRTNVKQLSGAVVVESEVRSGTTFRVTLPLTLAIVQAMMVRLGDDVYAIPLSSIVETLYLADTAVSRVKGRPVIQWRERVLPLVYLRRVFGGSDGVSGNDGQQAVVAVAWGKLQVGLMVDGLVGQQEIVIKSLGPFIGSVPGISGCTILGDGHIALIVDAAGLISICLQAQRQETTI
jgi:two-component system chemotaxis sensor kinase CheA